MPSTRSHSPRKWIKIVQRSTWCRINDRKRDFMHGMVLSAGYEHGRPVVCLDDGQTEAGGIPSQGGRGDPLLRRMSLYLTLLMVLFLPSPDRSLSTMSKTLNTCNNKLLCLADRFIFLSTVIKLGNCSRRQTFSSSEHIVGMIFQQL